jgi:hypothetical protein
MRVARFGQVASRRRISSRTWSARAVSPLSSKLCRLDVVRVVGGHLLEAADRPAPVLVIQRDPGGLEGGAVALQGVDPARHVRRVPEALDCALELPSALVGLAGAHQVAGRAVHLGSLLGVAGLLVERRGAAVVL